MGNNRTGKVVEVQRLFVKSISLGRPTDKKTAENMVRAFSLITNVNDGRSALFPIETVGKILRHKGFDFSRIIGDIPYLYETSVLGWSETEMPKAGHKAHPNVKGYHHYVNKFTDGANEYYIRFTVHEEKARPGRTGRNFVHSAAISNVAVYKKSGDSRHDRVTFPGEASRPPFVDRRLEQFFGLTNNKIIDSGEKVNRGS